MDNNLATRVFGLPELLHLILDHLWSTSDAPSFAALARVTRSWTDAVVTKRWECQTTLVPLSRIPATRQEYYANKIKTLCLGDLSELDTHLDDISVALVNLGTVELRKWKSSETRESGSNLETPAAIWTRKLLGDNVRTMRISSKAVSTNPDFLYALPQVCPRLRALEIWGNGEDVDATLQLHFVVRLLRPCLRIFTLSCNTFMESNPASGSAEIVFSTLSTLPGLETVKFGVRVLSRSNVTEMLDTLGDQQPFANLQRFDGQILMDQFDQLSRILPHSLKELKLQARDEPDWVPNRISGEALLPHLASFRQLQSLRLNMSANATIFKDDFLTLSNFHNLTRLAIRSKEGYWGERDGHEYDGIAAESITDYG